MQKYLIRFLPQLSCAFFFSLFINLLQLSYILYLRLLFDKVMTSRSGATLFYLTALVIGAYVVMGVIEVFRSRLLIRVSVAFDQVAAGRVFNCMLNHSSMPGGMTHTQGLKDLNKIRTFIGSTGIFALFDTPWVPVYLAIVFLFHPWLGYLACLGGVLLLALVVAQEIMTTRMRAVHSESSLTRDQFLASTMRNAQTVNCMGMLPALAYQWKQMNNQVVFLEDRLSARAAFFQTLAKFIMMSTVVLVMSVGALLVIRHEATFGTMIAASMFIGKALSPVIMLGGAWKSLVEARIAYKRLDSLMAEPESAGTLISQTKELRLPGDNLSECPGPLEVENIGLAIQGVTVLENVSFRINPGEVLAVTGPSGAGKSTLARIILGLWRPDSGRIRWGQYDMHALDRTEAGLKTGYMPQETELFAGTVAENISRMGEVDSPGVVQAAREARVHEMILTLPKGYDTRIGPGGINLSGGQKQRIALARSLYGKPWLLVMDEPDSHLDQGSRVFLKNLTTELKKKQVIVVIISHNQDLSRMADKTILMQNGRVAMENTKEDD